MATRATYKIEAMTFYCHWDGYPSGAACRMVNMIEAYTQPQTVEARKSYDPIDDRRGGLAFAFIRGNMDAQPTKSKNAHSDTEFHYEVFACKKTGLIRCRTFDKSWDDDPENFRLQSDDRLEDFCNHHGQEWNLPRIVSIKNTSWDGANSFTLATADAARAIAALKQASAMQSTNASNRDYYLKDADHWLAATA
jgi:hypothetical protein